MDATLEVNEDKLSKILAELKDKKKEQRETLQKLLKQVDFEFDTQNEIDTLTEIDAKAIYERLRKDSQHCVSLSERKNISCVEVLEKCSGGVCLKGYFYKGEGKITLCEKTLIGVRKEVLFRFSSLPESEFYFEFEDAETQSRYMEQVTSLGFSFAQNICAAFLIGGISEGSQHFHEKKYDVSNKSTDSTKLYGTITSVIVPVAQYEPHIQDMCLSENAKNELKTIDTLLTLGEEKPAEAKCGEFFEMYGSHLCIGTVHFGGIQNFTTTVSSILSIKKSKMKEIVRNEHKGFLSGFFSKFGIAKIDGDLSGGYTKQSGNIHKDVKEEKHYRTSSTINVIGGPGEVHTNFLWKKCVIDYNTTWAMIDRQCKKKCDFLGIWNLVLIESDQFENPEKLYGFLKKEWEKSTGLTVADDGQLITWKEKQFSKFIETVRSVDSQRNNKDEFLNMIKSISHTVTDFRKNEQLLQIWKKHLRGKTSICKEIIKGTKDNVSLMGDKTFSSWFSNLFRDINDIKYDGQEEIKCILAGLDQRSRLRCQKTKEVDLDMMCKIIDSGTVYQEAMHMAITEKISLEISITIILELYMDSLLKSVEKLAEPSRFLLVTGLLFLYNYDFDGNYFETQISSRKLIQFEIKMKRCIEEYEGISSSLQSKQAYCILLLFSSFRMIFDSEESFLESVMTFWEEGLQHLNIHPDISLLMKTMRTKFTLTEKSLKMLQNGANLKELLTSEYFESCGIQLLETSD